MVCEIHLNLIRIFKGELLRYTEAMGSLASQRARVAKKYAIVIQQLDVEKRRFRDTSNSQISQEAYLSSLSTNWFGNLNPSILGFSIPQEAQTIY